MRLIDIKDMRPVVVAAITLLLAVAPVAAQRYVPKPNEGETFKDTSMLKPPAGAKVAIIVFEDLECPACAASFPIEHQAAAHYNIPLVRRDFPLPMHIWSFDAAIWARYLQDKVSPKTGDDYRGAVFAAQRGIASKDDMLNFTRKFFQTHSLQMPFVPDPTGQFKKEVEADKAVGERLGVQYTPSISVVTQHEWVHVIEIDSLYATIDDLLAKTKSEPSAAKTIPAKKAVPHP
jgi:protein-disulfide isomerase